MLVNLADYEHEAGKTLPSSIYDYFRGGARDELTLLDNRAAFDRIRIRHRVLRGVGERDLSTTVGGESLSMPVMVAPMAMQRMAHDEGEVGTARGASKAGTIMVVSTMATMTLEDVATSTAAPKWFQVYVYRDRAVTEALVLRARRAGYRALVLTVDAPMVGVRERDVRNHFAMPGGLEFANFRDVGLQAMTDHGSGSELERYTHDQFDPSLTWDDVRWLIDKAQLPVWVKGIVHEEDAQRAVDAGAAGIIVSNHGGRQLDTAIATIDALPEVVAAVRGRVEVLMDGGVRRGTDVIKAIALGARAVLLGRPILYGLAFDGHAGVARVLDVLRREIDIDMALAGFRSVEDIREHSAGTLSRRA